MGITGKVAANSPLKRKNWSNETLEQLGLAADLNPFKDYIGNNFGSSIVTKVSPAAGKGHMITFDFSGELEGAVIVGADTTLIGTGEQKRKYFINTFMEELGTEVYNGTAFDLVNIGVNDPTNDKNHKDSIAKLSSAYNSKIMPQFMFDTFQHFLRPIGESSVANPIDTAKIINYDCNIANPVINKDLIDKIQLIAKTGRGFDVLPAGITATMPLTPVSGTKNGSNGVIYWFVDPYVYSYMLKGDILDQSQHADSRGETNRSNTRKVGRIGNIVIIEMPSYLGMNNPLGDGTVWNADGITGRDPATGTKGALNVAGMRRYDNANSAPEGTTGFVEATTDMHHRTFVVGASALLYPKGKKPDYRLQESTDYKRNSSSGLLWWCAIKKVVLTVDAAHDDNAVGKISGVDNFITVTVRVN